MTQAHVHSPVDEADYLRREEAASSKHELVGGEIYAMAGASERHNRISGNIFFHLRTATRGKACRAFMADMKLRLAASTTYYYPDAMLVCDTDDHGDHAISIHDRCDHHGRPPLPNPLPQAGEGANDVLRTPNAINDNNPIYKQSPCFIAEVLSPATAAIDLREKWAAYRALPSLRYYLLVDSERLWAKAFFRDAQDVWFEQELGADNRLDVACGDARLTLTLDDLYEDTGLLIV